MQIEPLAATHREGLAHLISHYRHGVIPPYHGTSREAVASHLASQFIERAGTGGVVLLGAHAAGLHGVVSLENLAWEGEIYGRRIARIPLVLAVDAEGTDAGAIYRALLQRLMDAARGLHYQDVLCRVRAEDAVLAHCFEEAGFRLMDTLVEFGWDLGRITIEERSGSWLVSDLARSAVRFPKFDMFIRPPTEDDVPVLMSLAADAFTERAPTHYAVDPHLPVEATRRLYAEWTRLGCGGSFADVVRVAADESGPIGFLMFKRDRELSDAVGVQVGDMGLAAVLPQRQGKGALPVLLCGVLSWCHRAGLEIARGKVLATNYGMQKSCLATGGAVAAAFHTFHAHLGVP